MRDSESLETSIVFLNYSLIVTDSTKNMYRVTDLHILDKIIEKVAASSFDIVGNSMYSCGLKKYKQFLESIS